MSSCWDAFVDIIPIICVMILYLWSYYCYMYEMVWKMVKPMLKQIIYAVILNILLIMTFWCYFATMCTPQDDVPDYFKPPFQIREAIRISNSEQVSDDIIRKFCNSRGITLVTRNSRGFVRYCYYCKHVKPDRTHHCSSCDCCILKMDHHCPWVAACISFSNYKKFLLFLIYTSLYLLYASSTMVEYCIEFFYIEEEDRDYFVAQILLACPLGFAIGITVFSFLIYHLTLVFSNQTTLEAITEPNFIDDELTFNISPGYNFCQVFGYDIGCWFIPVGDSPGNGVTYYTTRK